MGSKVLLTGATGYIGGAVLFELLHSGAKLDITALVRSKDSASKLPKEVKTIVGANEDYDVLRDAASHANIVIHTANSADDEHGPEAIAEGLSKNGGWYIHTSGNVIGEDKNAKIFYDESGIAEIHQLPDGQPHRNVDKKVFFFEKKYPNVKTVIVCPPTIHGISQGYSNRISIQIPLQIKAMCQLHKVGTVGPGLNLWSYVHVEDLGRLYALLVETMVSDPSKVAHGYEGYYFAEVGEYRIVEIAAAIGKLLKQKGKVDDPTPKPYSPDDIKQLTGTPDGANYVGSSSRSRAERARKLGWKGREKNIFETLPEELDAVLAGDSKASWKGAMY